MEKEYIKLADGREVRRGPWIEQRSFFEATDKFRVGIFVISQSMLQHGERWGDSITILEVDIPAGYYSIKLPGIRIHKKELWTKELVGEVIRELRQSDKGKRAIEYIFAKLCGAFEKEKELILEDGRRLLGDLEFDIHCSLPCSIEVIGHDDLVVFGNIKDLKTGSTEKTALLTIKHLYPNFWPGTNIKPGYLKNKEIWCKKLEFLVINYLNLLVNFASAPLDKQISEIARDLASRSEWAVKCHNIFQRLMSLDPDSREDQRISQALELIDEVGQI